MLILLTGNYFHVKKKTFREDTQGTFLVLYSLYKKITDSELNIYKTTKMVIHVKKIAFILKMHKPSVILSDSMINM